MNKPGSTSFEVVTLTNVGIKRSGSPNQDSVGSVLPHLFQSRPPLLILADGMGGYAGGSQASHLVVEAFKRVYLSHSPEPDSLPTLNEALKAALADIREFSKNKPELESMGSTVVAVALHPDHFDLLNVGDSRAYLIRGGQLIQISLDQSLVAELVRQGIMTPEEAQVSPKRNQLNMALSAKREHVDPFVKTIPMQKGDGVLMCSDGLWGSVAEVLIQAVATELPPRVAAAKLIELANKAGGSDNISVVIAMPKDAVKRMQSRQAQGSSDETKPGQKTAVQSSKPDPEL
jgi:PPM family protein phosphatase